MISKFTCSRNQLKHFIQKLHAKGTPPIIDYVREIYDVKNFYELQRLIHKYPGDSIALKPSTLGIKENVSICVDNMDKLIYNAMQNNCKVYIDAEEHDIQEKIDELSNYFLYKYNKDRVNVYKTYQMYKNDMPSVLKQDLECDRNYYLGVKLVRGAYYNMDYSKGVLCKTIEETHKQYDDGIIDFCKLGKSKDVLLCATHNYHSIELALQMIQYDNRNIEFAQLLGMNDAVTNDLQKLGHRVYKYLPYGDFRESIPYLVRRLYENYGILKYIL